MEHVINDSKESKSQGVKYVTGIVITQWLQEGFLITRYLSTLFLSA